MKMKKKVLAAVLSVVLAMSLAAPVYAATASKISIVRLKVTGEKPEAGEDIGIPEIEVTTGHCSVSEEPEFYKTKEDDVWVRGEVPTIKLMLESDNDYKFTSSTKVYVDGLKAKLKSKSVKSSGEELQVYITLPNVSGDLESVSEHGWSGRNAEWEKIEGASYYEVKLYRNGSAKETILTNSRKFDFYPYMVQSGDYSFKVRAISSSDNVKSAWSEISEEYYVSSSQTYNGTKPTNHDYRNNSSSNSGAVPGHPAGSQWLSDANGWSYWTNGVPARSQWVYDGGEWYFLGSNGYMLTGWQYIDNNWFYLNPNSDGTKGAMKTGVQIINNGYYYLNPVSDGTKGALLTGFQMINGNYYFFDTSNGMMWANRYAPNGKWIDASGIVQL